MSTSSQPSNQSASSSQCSTASQNLQNEIRAKIDALYPDSPQEDIFFEVPSHFARHNHLFRQYTLPAPPSSLSIPYRTPTPLSTPLSSLSSVTPSPVMANITTMPPCGHASAPKFSPDQPRELQ